MASIFTTKRLSVRKATANDVKRIIETENAAENRQYIWQGTYEEHINEIEGDTDLLLVFEDKEIKTL